jgi:hypothetical protein
VIDEHRTIFHAAKGTLLSPGYSLDVCIAADAGKDDIGVFRRSRR